MARPTILTRVDKSVQERFIELAKVNKRPVQYFAELALNAYVSTEEIDTLPEDMPDGCTSRVL